MSERNAMTPVGDSPAPEGEIIPPPGPPPEVPPATEVPPAAEVPEPDGLPPPEAAYVDPADRPLPQLRPTVAMTDPADPEEIARFDAESIALINTAQDNVDEAEKEYQVAAEAAKGAKKIWEARQTQLNELIKERRELRGKPRQKSLLDFVPKADVHVDGGDNTVAPVESDPTPDPLENLFREVPLQLWADKGWCRPKDVSILADGVRKNGLTTVPLRTVGELGDFTANRNGSPGYENRLTDFRGLGDKGEERVSAAEVEFWKWWNNGGREEFAAQRGVGGVQSQDATEPGAGGEAPGHAGGDGDGGEPAGPAAGADGEAADPHGVDSPVWVPTAAELEEGTVAEPPDGPDEYSLG